MNNELLDHLPRLKVNRSGYYVLVWAERGGDGKYRTRERSLNTTVRADAEAMRRALLAAPPPGDEATSVGALLDGYTQNARDRNVGVSSLNTLKAMREALGRHQVGELTPELLRAYRASRKVCDATVRHEFCLLNAALNWGVKHRKLVITDKPIIDLPDAGTPRTVFLDEVQEARLWAIAAQDEDPQSGHLTARALFVLLALGTGARSGAIRALTWDRVDLKAATIDYRLPGERQTKKRKVVTVINKRLMPVLTRAWGERQAVRQVCGRDNLRRTLEGFLAVHGFGHVTPHMFRHTFVTLSLRAGMRVFDVAELAGMSPKMVLEVYGHAVVDARLQDVANKRFA